MQWHFFLKTLSVYLPIYAFLPSLLFAWEFSTYCEFGKFHYSKFYVKNIL